MCLLLLDLVCPALCHYAGRGELFSCMYISWVYFLIYFKTCLISLVWSVVVSVD
ncbi:unnamed protein product, partial [Staurois parvus]